MSTRSKGRKSMHRVRFLLPEAGIDPPFCSCPVSIHLRQVSNSERTFGESLFNFSLSSEMSELLLPNSAQMASGPSGDRWTCCIGNLGIQTPKVVDAVSGDLDCCTRMSAERIRVSNLPVVLFYYFLCNNSASTTMWNYSKTRLLLLAFAIALCVDWSVGQQRGSYNFAKKTGGERDGDLTPSAIAGVSIAVVAGVAGMIVTVFFCYYVYRQQKQHESFSNSFEARRY